MIITSKNKNIKKLENGIYLYIGNICSNQDITIKLDNDLIVIGDIDCKGSVNSEFSLKVTNGEIFVGKDIIVNNFLICEKNIYAGRLIKAEYILSFCTIEAGMEIIAYQTIFTEDIKAGQGIRAGMIFSGHTVYSAEFVKSYTTIGALDGVYTKLIDAKCYVVSKYIPDTTIMRLGDWGFVVKGNNTRKN